MSKNCGNCNYENEDHSNFCQACGAPLTQPAVQESSQASPMPPPVPQTPIPPTPPAPPANVRPEPPAATTGIQPTSHRESATVSPPGASYPDKNETPRFYVDENTLPVSVGAFFIMMLLFSIPVVNIIMMIIWAVGSKNKSKQNFAIATLIWFFLAIILGVIIAIAFFFFLSLSATMMSGREEDIFNFLQKIFNSL